jgi:Protein of unknown function (DUF2793)
MANPIVFPSVTPNLSLPLLFLGQAQKEPFINQAMSVIDALLMGVIEGSLATPPSSPDDGSSFRILSGANGDWTGHDGELAIRVGGSWNFISPSDGSTVFDRNARVQLRYDSGWVTATTPAQPTGGTTIDAEARSAISDILDALRTAGILPDST